MNANVAASSAMETSSVTGSVTLAAVWNRFWFTPADGRPLALLRIGTASLAIVLWWSYAPDVLSWFGPAGILPADAVQQWRSPAGFSLFDAATTSASLNRMIHSASYVPQFERRHTATCRPGTT